MAKLYNMKSSVSISKSTKQRQELSTILASILILLFAYTGLGKLIDQAVFAIQLNKQPLPNWSKPILVWMLPAIELGIVALLLSARTRLWGFYFAFALLTAYTIYVAIAASGAYGHTPCACGKIFQKLSWLQHFFVNLALTAIAYMGIRFKKTPTPPT